MGSGLADKNCFRGEFTPESKLSSALLCRSLGHRLYPDQVDLLAHFDAAPVDEKARMLGDYWPVWKQQLNL